MPNNSRIFARLSDSPRLGAALLATALAACGSGDSDGPNGPVAGAGGTSGAPSAGSGGATTPGAGSGGAPAGGAGGAGAAGTGTSGAGSSAGGASGSGGAAPGGGGAGGSGGAAAGAAGSGGATAGAGGATNCMTPPAPGPLLGWAATGSGTTGGGNATPVVVTSAADLSTNLAGTAARVIHVSGSLSGNFSVGSNKTVIGVCGAELRGHIGFNGSSNVIFRNLRVVGYNCSDSPQQCSAGADAIGIGNGAHHLWFDHLDVSDGSDGNLDITNGSDFITVSWTKFSYSTRRTDPVQGASGHRFSNLIGAADAVPADAGKLNVTFHHNWWADNVDQRMPRTRAGQIHVFNNLYTSAGNSYCTNAGYDAKLLVQNNVYRGVSQPFNLSTYPSTPEHNGNMRIQGNETPSSTGVSSPTGTGFTPPYSVTLDATSSVEAAVRSGAGPR